MLPAMNLNYLIFDCSEDTDGTGSFDTMASTDAEHAQAVRDEVAAVLAWAHQAFGAVEQEQDGDAAWRYELQAQREWSVVEHLHFDVQALRLQADGAEARPGTVRHTITLTLCGRPDFCAALRQRFSLD